MVGYGAGILCRKPRSGRRGNPPLKQRTKITKPAKAGCIQIRQDLGGYCDPDTDIAVVQPPKGVFVILDRRFSGGRTVTFDVLFHTLCPGRMH